MLGTKRVNGLLWIMLTEAPKVTEARTPLYLTSKLKAAREAQTKESPVGYIASRTLL